MERREIFGMLGDFKTYTDVRVFHISFPVAIVIGNEPLEEYWVRFHVRMYLAVYRPSCVSCNGDMVMHKMRAKWRRIVS